MIKTRVDDECFVYTVENFLTNSDAFLETALLHVPLMTTRRDIAVPKSRGIVFDFLQKQHHYTHTTPTSEIITCVDKISKTLTQRTGLNLGKVLNAELRQHAIALDNGGLINTRSDSEVLEAVAIYTYGHKRDLIVSKEGKTVLKNIAMGHNSLTVMYGKPFQKRYKYSMPRVMLAGDRIALFIRFLRAD